ncbi:MAG TPA: flagellar basal body-associated FliL family protein [Ignavibacteriales bacterium]|jgi:flagellar FliL protein|nr:flagellar basal body-associated FliL family protein [Ignavibacteriales bacterium]
MADEEKKKKSSGGGGFNIKGLLIGIPLFALHTIAVYFITANFILNKKVEELHKKEMELDKKLKAQSAAQKLRENPEGFNPLLPFDTPEELEEDEGQKREFGKYLYNLEDVTVNPAGTAGSKILLVSLAIDVPAQKYHDMLTQKKIMVDDAVLSVLTSKTVPVLENVNYRDTLKLEIGRSIKSRIPGLRINNIYFSKFIIQ